MLIDEDFLLCEPPAEIVREPRVELVFSDPAYSVYHIIVHPRCWRTDLQGRRWLNLDLPSMVPGVPFGSIMGFLLEKKRVLALPLDYYQNKRKIRLSCFHRNGQCRIELSPGFVLYAGISFEFRLIYVKPLGIELFAEIDLGNERLLSEMLKLEGTEGHQAYSLIQTQEAE